MPKCWDNAAGVLIYCLSTTASGPVRNLMLVLYRRVSPILVDRPRTLLLPVIFQQISEFDFDCVCIEEFCCRGIEFLNTLLVDAGNPCWCLRAQISRVQTPVQIGFLEGNWQKRSQGHFKMIIELLAMISICQRLSGK